MTIAKRTGSSKKTPVKNGLNQTHKSDKIKEKEKEKLRRKKREKRKKNFIFVKLKKKTKTKERRKVTPFKSDF